MSPRKLLVAGVATIVVLLAAALGASFFVDVDSFRPQLEEAMTTALGRPVAIGHVSLSLLSRSVSIDNLAVADDPAFGAGRFLSVKTVRAGVALRPLLFSRSLRVESFRLQEPELTLRRSAAGTWNFSTLGASSAPAGRTGSSSSLSVSIDRLALTNGRVIVELAGATAARRVYEDVSVDVRDLSTTTRFPFRIGATAPGHGVFALDGRAGPLSPEGVGATPFEASLNVKHLDVGSSGLVEPGAGIAGLVDLALRIVSNGRRVTSTGTFRGEKLKFMSGGSPSQVPVEIACESQYDLATHDGTVTRGDVHVGHASASLTGRFNTSGDKVTVQMTLAGHRMPVSDLQAMLPAIAMTPPRGARFQSGTLDADLTIAGPLDRYRVSGPLTISDATLAGFDLASQMRVLAWFAGLPSAPDTVIRTLAASVHVAPDGIRASALRAEIPAIGSVTGEGTITPNGGVSFRMLATLTRTNLVGDTLMRIASLGRPENGIPFRIEGTTATPSFVPDVGRALEGLMKSPGDAVTGLADQLFGKKKK